MHNSNLRTVPALLDYCQEKHGSRSAFAWREGEVVHTLTYECLAGRVRTLAAFFAGQTQPEARIALVGGNSIHWLLAWFAIVGAGRVAVPMDPQLTQADYLDLLKKSGAELLLYEDSFSDVAAAFPRSLRLDELPAESNAANWPCARQADDLAMIAYTSGTTGQPKGAMLTHWNLMSDALSGCRCMDLEGHKLLAILPFHHTLSLTPGMLAQLPGGSTVCICGGMKHLTKDLKAFQPQYTVVVPLLAEGMYQKVWDTARKEGKEKLLRALVRLSGTLRLGIGARRRLFKSVLEAFGGKLEWMLCGGAPISQDCVAGFLRFGIEVLPAYGVTECSPGVSLNQRGQCRPQSVGRPLDCNEVKIEDGEILIRGDNVFPGYYNNEQATQEAMTADGWHKTGDLGMLDEDGYLYITGRLKNLIILSNGKNVSPEGLEQKLTEIPYILEALVYQEDDVIAAQLYLDPDVPDAAAQLEGDLLELNRQLPVYQRITKTTLRDTEFPKTTSKKIKRK